MEEICTEYALGIDLGTTYSCVSVFRNGAIEIITNEIEERTTPSVVTFLENNEIKVGEETLSLEIKNPKNTIYSIKRLMGRDFDQNLIEEIKKENWPFEVVKSTRGSKPVIKLELNNETKGPEEISSLILKKLLKSAKEYLKVDVNKAVITVPHNFLPKQKEATKLAAQMAGIQVLGILSEPTAASLAYGFEKKISKISSELSNENEKEKYILTFDLGGGTFDITLLEISEKEEHIFNVKATSGDNFLGGDDFDNRLFNYCLDKFCEFYNIDKNIILNDKKSSKKLKKQCENAKKLLSIKLETNIYIAQFIDEKDLDVKITREKFEELCKDLFDQLIIHIEKVLTDGRIKKENIKKVILVGGSTKIPRVREIITNYFGDKKKINCEINPDETVAYGAGLYAAKLMQQGGEIINDIVLMDITPLSLGTSVINKSTDPKIKSLGCLMDFIIPRGTRIPITLYRYYVTVIDNQTEMTIDIYEGERKYIKDNHLLGQFKIDLPPKPMGEIKIKISINVDINGIFIITAEDKTGNIKGKIKIKNDKELITEEEYKEILEKNKNILNKNISNEEKNFKGKINEYFKYYLEEKDVSYKIQFLKEYNKSIIEFIKTFDLNNLENVTIFEKLYLYVKLLFESYCKILFWDNNIDSNFEEELKSVSKEYLKLIFEKNPYYIQRLLPIYNEIKDKLLYDIVIFAMRLYYDKGKRYLDSQNITFKNYKARNDFINCLKLGNDYIRKTRLALLKDLKTEYDRLVFDSNSKINLIEASLKINIELKDDYDNFKLFDNDGTEILDKDGLLVLLGKYREALSNLLENNKDNKDNKKQNKTEKNQIELEAIISANIVKIQYTLLQKDNYDILKKLAEHSVNLAMSINKNWDTITWFKEIKEILEKIREIVKQNEEKEKQMFEEQMLIEKKEIFDEIEEMANKNNIEFIKFIIKKYPPKKYNESEISIDKEWEENKVNLINVLCSKYNQQSYPRNTDEEKEKYLIVGKIYDHLNIIYHDIVPNENICEID